LTKGVDYFGNFYKCEANHCNKEAKAYQNRVKNIPMEDEKARIYGKDVDDRLLCNILHCKASLQQLVLFLKKDAEEGITKVKKRLEDKKNPIPPPMRKLLRSSIKYNKGFLKKMEGVDVNNLTIEDVRTLLLRI
jgi:hypothetical protein